MKDFPPEDKMPSTAGDPDMLYLELSVDEPAVPDFSDNKIGCGVGFAWV